MVAPAGHGAKLGLVAVKVASSTELSGANRKDDDSNHHSKVSSKGSKAKAKPRATSAEGRDKGNRDEALTAMAKAAARRAKSLLAKHK